MAMRWLGAWFSRREVTHGLFWLAAGLFFLWYEWSSLGSPREIVALLTNLGFYAAIVYFNLGYLFPNFLNEKQVGIYMLLFVLAAAIATPLRSMVLYWLYERSPSIKEELLNDQFTLFLSHLAVGSASTMLKIASDWTRSTRERQRLQAENLQSELKFLRTQINPHFLFNTLNSLYALTLKKSDQAPETVLKLSEMMRYMLYDSNARLVSLSKEVDYLRNYVGLEQLRHRDQADIQFDVHGEIKDQQIAPMILVTFVENAFKHGLSGSLANGYVHMGLFIEEQEVRFHIENSKPALPEVAGQVGGIGLINVGRRLELIYPESYELQTLETDELYAVDLYLNLSLT